MDLLNTFHFIVSHPLNKSNRIGSICRFLKWQIGSRLIHGEIVYPWLNGIKFFVRPGETGLTGNIYTGLHEFNDMAFMLHYINEKDLFIDIGANAGSYTLLSCGVKRAKGYSFEPVLPTYKRLCENIHLNHLETRVRVLNMGLSDKPGYLQFTVNEDCMNHVLIEKNTSDTIKVKTETLDRILGNKNPSVMKIDVEGYEVPVLKGAKKTLKKLSLSAVLIETNGSGIRYGYCDEEIVVIMSKNNFFGYSYDPLTRQFCNLEKGYSSPGNTLFIRNINRVKNRVSAARHFEILRKQF